MQTHNHKNLFELFIGKFLAFPFWVKLAVYSRLRLDLQKNYYKHDCSSDSENSFVSFVPTISFKGKNELREKVFGFDTNIYNF